MVQSVAATKLEGNRLTLHCEGTQGFFFVFSAPKNPAGTQLHQKDGKNEKPYKKKNRAQHLYRYHSDFHWPRCFFSRTPIRITEFTICKFNQLCMAPLIKNVTNHFFCLEIHSFRTLLWSNTLLAHAARLLFEHISLSTRPIGSIGTQH